MQPTFWASRPPTPKHAAPRCHPERNAAAQTHSNSTSANYSPRPWHRLQSVLFPPSKPPASNRHFERSRPTLCPLRSLPANVSACLSEPRRAQREISLLLLCDLCALRDLCVKSFLRFFCVIFLPVAYFVQSSVFKFLIRPSALSPTPRSTSPDTSSPLAHPPSASPPKSPAQSSPHPDTSSPSAAQ
jgi:hypothetical protein